jgi:hypothetical protein
MEDTNLIDEELNEKHMAIYHILELEKLIEKKILNEMRKNRKRQDHIS